MSNKILEDSLDRLEAISHSDEAKALLGVIREAAAVIDGGKVEMLLWCPQCHVRHVDKGEFAARSHASHACQYCGMVWRPAVVNTVGVQHLPGFKDPER